MFLLWSEKRSRALTPHERKQDRRVEANRPFGVKACMNAHAVNSFTGVYEVQGMKSMHACVPDAL